MPLLDHAGGAAPTTLSGSLAAGATSTAVVAAINWPSGGVNGNFYITIGRGLSNEERIKVGSRSGTTLSSLTRGVDGTSDTSHNAGETVEHTLSAEEIDDLNAFVNGTDVVTSTHIAASAVGSSELAASAVTAGKIAVGGISAANQFASGVVDAAAIATDAVGSAEIAALAVGTGEIADLAVTAAKIANDTITATQIAADAVGASELANNAVDSGAIAAAAVTAGKIAAGGVSATNQITDAIVTLAKMASEISQDYTPTAASFATGSTLTIGTGGTTYGHYFKIGRMVAGWAGFNMAADGNLPAGGTIQIPLPVAMRTVGSDGFRCFVAARIRRASDGFVSSGTGVITASSTASSSLTSAGVSAQWDATNPINPGTPGDGACSLDALFFYEAAS